MISTLAESKTVAVNFCVCPCSIVEVCGSTRTRPTGIGVTRTFSVSAFSSTLAISIAVPTALGVTRPAGETSMTAGAVDR